MKSKPDITLIAPDSPFLITKNMFPPLGIMYLAAFFKQRGLEVQCLDMGGLGHTLDMVEADVIGISITTPQRDSAFEIANHFKDSGKLLIAGGPHATHVPDECQQEGITTVIRGYGEASLYNLFTFGEPIDQPYIDSLPYPDRDVLPIKKYKQWIDGRPATVIMASRGCPFRCSFCANIKGNFQIQSAQRTIDEIDHVQYTYGYSAFTLYDDTFVIDKNRLKIMADVFEKRDLRFRCFCRADLLSDSICAELARMGVVAVGVGVESGSNEILKLNLKGTNRDTNIKAIHNLRKHGIESKAFLIVGLPGESHDTVEQTRSWIEEACPDDIAVSVFQPLPGSAIFRNPEKWGVDFVYNGQPMWYRGKPGEYKPTVRTKHLSTQEIIDYREKLEATYKPGELLK